MEEENEDLYRLVGTTVAEKYAVERVAGSGGFATVYRARHLLWDRPVALKVFKVLENVSAEVRQKMMADFNKEGALLAELSERSSTFAQARDVGMLTTSTGEMVPFMVLEWLEGRTLDAMLDADKFAGRRYTFDEAFQILAPALEALALAHSRGIAHRDIKPANLFVVTEPDGHSTLKLLDFGIAKVVQDARKGAGEFSKTTGQMTSFTPLYGAPEQFSRSLGATGPWTDVFAMGLIFTEMLSAMPPLLGDDLTQVAFASTNPHERPTPRSKGVQLPNEIEAVLARAVEVSPDKRWSSCGEFYQALLQAAPQLSGPRSTLLSATGPNARSPLSASSPGALSESRRQEFEIGNTAPVSPATAVTAAASSGGKGGLVTLLGLGLVAVVGVGAFFALRGKEKEPEPPLTAQAPAASVSVVADVKPKCPRPDMIYVQGGRMFMGSNKGAKNEMPEHPVQLDAYCIDRYEVTVERYVACTGSGNCQRSEPTNNKASTLAANLAGFYDPICSLADAKSGADIPAGKAKLPINCIDHEHAIEFCTFEKGRLPTEAEWEHAARGSDQREYPWNDDPPGPTLLNACDDECLAWFAKNPKASGGYAMKPMYKGSDAFATLAPVGSFPAGKSPYGVEDLAGNVFEWVADWYGDYPTDKAVQSNPKGPGSGTERVVRGGAWNSSDPTWMRPSFRYSFLPDARSHGVGFRCVAAPQ